MLQTMLNASIAVLTRPSVSTFEEYEQDNPQWATIYVALGAVITGILGAISFAVQRPMEQIGVEEQPSLIGSVFGNVLLALIGFFIFLGIVYLLGRAFGGSGKFGELAFDISLYWVPIAVLTALVRLISIGFLDLLLLPVSLALFVYNIYLTYLGIQSGMDLPANKALYVVLILALIVIVLVVCVAVIIGAAIAALLSGTN